MVFRRLKILFLFISTLSFFFVVPAFTQTDSALFLDREIASDQRSQMDIDKNPVFIRRRQAMINVPALTQNLNPAYQADGQTSEITINLFDDATYKAIRTGVTIRGENDYTWLGKIKGVKNSQVTMTVLENQMMGLISIGSQFYEIRMRSGGIHTILEVNPSKNPPELAPKIAPLSYEDKESGDIQWGEDSHQTIDVLVVYTTAVRNSYGSTAAIVAAITNDVSNTNVAYTNSGVNQQINLVATAEIDLIENNSMETDLDNITDSTSNYTETASATTLARLRSDHKADLVVLIGIYTDNCGISMGVEIFWPNSV